MPIDATKAAYLAVVDALPMPGRETFLLARVDYLTCMDISLRLGMDIAVVKHNLASALARITNVLPA